ncbi:hypothetical protein JW933_06865 [candidate division FCPU426 bacterium]|nr:hypothetical protein [candidate division FCPU426 bacterium]
MRINPAFKKTLHGLHLDALDKSPDIIYWIDADYCLQGYNQAWLEFARQNNGACVLEKFPLGTSIMAAFADKPRHYYWQAYHQTLYSHKRFEYDYECPSAEQFRLYHQTVVPLKKNAGLMICNHLVKNGPILLAAHKIEKCYFLPNGCIVQCGHCRKVQNLARLNKWDWVPALVAKPQPDITYAICPRCLGMYHSGFMRTGNA